MSVPTQRQPLFLGLFVAFGLIIACAALLLASTTQSLVEARARSLADAEQYDTVLFHRSCAPWDGPAVEFEFYTSPAKCGGTQASALRISLWKNLPPKPGQKIELGTSAQLGTAIHCSQNESCEAIKSGSVLIETYENGKDASGSYDLTFPKAGHLTGRFRATWCTLRVFCG